jgi:hypothetical protein
MPKPPIDRCFFTVATRMRPTGEALRRKELRCRVIGQRLLVLLPLLVGASNLRCGPPEPCHAEHLGKTFVVTLVKRLSFSNCVSDPDALLGQSFTIQVLETLSPDTGSCRCGTGPIVSSPDTVTWSNPREPLGGCYGNFYNAEVDVANGDCSATAELSIQGDVTNSANPDSTGATLRYSEDACSCGGRFNVTIREIPSAK